MKLDVKAPDGQIYSKFGASPIVVTINHGPAGIYTILVTGVSGLGVNGEAPFVSVARLEPGTSANLMLNRAGRRGFPSQDLDSNVQVWGVSNLSLMVVADWLAAAPITGPGRS